MPVLSVEESKALEERIKKLAHKKEIAAPIKEVAAETVEAPVEKTVEEAPKSQKRKGKKK